VLGGMGPLATADFLAKLRADERPVLLIKRDQRLDDFYPENDEQVLALEHLAVGIRRQPHTLRWRSKETLLLREAALHDPWRRTDAFESARRWAEALPRHPEAHARTAELALWVAEAEGPSGAAALERDWPVDMLRRHLATLAADAFREALRLDGMPHQQHPLTNDLRTMAERHLEMCQADR